MSNIISLESKRHSSYRSFLDTYGDANWRQSALADFEAVRAEKNRTSSITGKPEKRSVSLLQKAGLGVAAVAAMVGAGKLAYNFADGGTEFSKQYLSHLTTQPEFIPIDGMQGAIFKVDPGLTTDPEGMQDVMDYMYSELKEKGSHPDPNAESSGHQINIPVIPSEQSSK